MLKTPFVRCLCIAAFVLTGTACSESSKTQSQADTPGQAPVADAPAPIEAPDVKFDGTVIHVSGDEGADANDGGVDTPVATVGKALEIVKTIDGPVKIAVAKGIYREGGLRITRRPAPLIIEGSAPGEVVVSGADVWSDWTERDGTLVAHWPHDWGMMTLGPLFPKRDHEAFRPAGKRVELVIVNDELLTQVITAEELAPGTYRVDEDADELIVKLPEGVDASTAVIEVGVRPSLLVILQGKDVTLRNLAFRYAVNSPLHKDVPFAARAVAVFGEHKSTMTNEEAGPGRNFAENITFEHVYITHNNHGGLTLANTKHFIARHCKFDDNGVTGIGANRNRCLTFEDCSFDRNNWRMGKLGHVIGWGPAGTKMLFMSDLTFTRCTFNDNYATGLWMDTAVEELVVDDCVMKGNWGTGFYFEHNQGPGLVKNSLITRNGYNDGTREIRIADGGVLYAESEDLTLENNRIIDNVNYQVGVRSRDRPGYAYWSGKAKTIDGSCRRLTMRNNIVVGSSYDGENVPSFYKPDEHRISTLVGRQAHSQEDWYIRDFPTTFQGSGNRYYNPVAAQVFSTGKNYGYDRLDLAGWQRLTGQDLDSVWEKPAE